MHTEDKTVDVVIKVLELVIKEHDDVGRHEINRTDLASALTKLRANGLAPTEEPIDKRMADAKGSSIDDMM